MGVLRLKKRSDFQSLSKKGRKAFSASFVLLAQDNNLSDHRVGFTATKKTIGNAVKRNRAKRRLRALVHEHFKNNPQQAGGDKSLDMVLIARTSVLEQNFAEMQKDFAKAFNNVAIERQKVKK